MIEQLISSPVSCRFLLKKTVAYSKYTISNIHLQTLNRQGEQISQKLKSPIYEHSFPGGVHCYRAGVPLPTCLVTNMHGSL